MWRRIYRNFRETIARGATLIRELPEEIHNAETQSWNADLTTAIRQDVERYFRDVARFLNALSLLAFVPFFLVGFFIFNGKPNVALWNIYLGWVIVVAIGVSWLMWSAVLLTHHIRRLPEKIYRELLWPLWLNTELVNLVISLGLFIYIYFSWNISGSHPTLAILGLLWLAAPFVIYLLHRSSAFVYIRLVQFVLLLGVALFTDLSPIPLNHFQWAAKRGLANELRPTVQKEITSTWETTEWFTQEGDPNVWYSFSTDRGYHLFTAPGRDPETNQELKPVNDKETKDQITSLILARKAELEKQTELENAKRAAAIQAEAEQKNADALVQAEREKAAALAQAEEERAENREMLIQTYVFPSMTKIGPDGHRTVLIVMNANQEEAPELEERISSSLNSMSVANEKAVFRPQFITSPMFREILAGAVAPDRQFHAENFADRLIVIQSTTAFSPLQPYSSITMTAADTKWTIRLISPGDGRVLKTFEIVVRGTGFKETDALKASIDRAITRLAEIASDIKAAL